MTNITKNYKTRIELIKDKEGRLCLKDLDSETQHPICVDFLSDTTNYRRKYGGGFSQAIAKAIGVTGKYKPYVIDATAGLGQDSFVLASLGCEVLMLERSPQIFAILEDGLKRLQNITNRNDKFSYREIKELSDIESRSKLINTDSIEFLKNLKENEKPDVIYLDPMFPEKQKTALSKKEMTVFKKFIGQDSDADKLLNIALKKAKKRVVVKRPRKSEFLSDIKPSHSIIGKANRFDIYAISSI